MSDWFNVRFSAMAEFDPLQSLALPKAELQRTNANGIGPMHHLKETRYTITESTHPLAPALPVGP
jgi:hypothetical protein